MLFEWIYINKTKVKFLKIRNVKKGVKQINKRENLKDHIK